jgi:prolyl-tRNA synthetase
MEADTGPIGGDMSHEFIILADTGESGVFFHKDWLKTDIITNIDYSADLEPVINKFTELYARTDEKHEPGNCPIKSEDLVEKRGIEVGHIFYFGTKYSNAMGASVSGTDGKPVDLHMGSYGIGVSRLVGGIIEASHDEKGIIWPEAVAPFKIAIVNLKPGNMATDELSETLYQAGLSNGHDCLYDDSKDSAGAKLATMDLIGIPWQIVVGPRGLERNSVEIKHRKSGSVAEITPEMAHDFMSSQGSLSMPEADILEEDIPDAN